MESPNGDGSRQENSSFDLGGILSCFTESVKDIKSCYPSRWHAMQLWQAFVSNVDPIVKILHIPTTEYV